MSKTSWAVPTDAGCSPAWSRICRKPRKLADIRKPRRAIVRRRGSRRSYLSTVAPAAYEHAADVLQQRVRDVEKTPQAAVGPEVTHADVHPVILLVARFEWRVTIS